MALPPQQNYVEYKLKASCLSSFSHHLMTLSSNSNSIGSFAPPVRMYRDESVTSPMAMEWSSPLEGEEGQPGRFGFPSKRRSKVLSQDVEHEKKQTAMLGPDVHPWVIEDGDGEHALVGKREGGQQSHYVFFVNQGNSFLIVPVTHWYRFAPKSSAPQLSLEEVEALMAGPKRKKASKKSPIVQEEEEVEGSSEGGNNILEQIKQGIQEENPPQGSLPAMRAMIQASAVGRDTPSADSLFRHAEELDYDEIFEDDEEVGFDETMYGESDDPSAPVPVRASRAVSGSLSLAGKNLRRIVQSHDKGVVEEDSEDEDDFDSQKPSPAPAPPALAAAKPQLAQQTSSLAKPPATESVIKLKRPHSSHSPSPPSSPSPSPSPSASQPMTGEVVRLTEQAIITVLRKGPIKTKDLIYHFKQELKDPDNKTLFREVVRKVAAVNASASSSMNENEKTLVIKPEYK